jgi:hypothetical protein
MKEYWMLATTSDLGYVDPEDEGSKLLLNADNKCSDILVHMNCHNTAVRTSKVSHSRYLKNLTLNQRNHS